MSPTFRPKINHQMHSRQRYLSSKKGIIKLMKYKVTYEYMCKPPSSIKGRNLESRLNLSIKICVEEIVVRIDLAEWMLLEQRIRDGTLLWITRDGVSEWEMRRRVRLTS